MILAGFRRRSQARIVEALYGAVVAQARVPAFYRNFGVADTVDARFDMLVLHLVLLLRRLGQESELRRSLGQDLFDAFCRDLDANLREMGVGDLAVPKRMQHFAEAFYGRQAAYLEALESADPKAQARAIENALARNIFAGDTGAHAARLADYVRSTVRDLDAQADDALNRGTVVFRFPELEKA